jgi:hypothetical protein
VAEYARCGGRHWIRTLLHRSLFSARRTYAATHDWALLGIAQEEAAPNHTQSNKAIWGASIVEQAFSREHAIVAIASAVTATSTTGIASALITAAASAAVAAKGVNRCRIE